MMLSSFGVVRLSCATMTIVSSAENATPRQTLVPAAASRQIVGRSRSSAERKRAALPLSSALRRPGRVVEPSMEPSTDMLMLSSGWNVRASGAAEVARIAESWK